MKKPKRLSKRELLILLDFWKAGNAPLQTRQHKIRQIEAELAKF